MGLPGLRFVIAATFALALGLATSARAQALGPAFESTAEARQATAATIPTPSPTLDVVRRWNRIAVDASGLDHTPVAAGETRTFGEQLGPGRSARAMAIVHIAMFEALNAIEGRYRSYLGLAPARPNTSRDAAVARAARDTLAAMFPSQARTFDRFLLDEMRRLPLRDAAATLNGLVLGGRAASEILARRAADGSQHAEPRMGEDYVPDDGPGIWRQDPISLSPVALGAHWGEVRPFVLRSADQFRLPPPPAMESDAYAAAFAEVTALGGDGVTTPTTRTPDQTEAGIYWAYDGTPSLCAPPRLYNQIAVQIATIRRTSVYDLARLLALVNVGMADAGVASWESKFHYAFWRPVTAVREADGDGNPDTEADAAFSPLGAPASNLLGPNFTPPFPAYPSGHATFGGTLFQMLRNFYGTDRIPFTFVSDELNGATRDNAGNVRPLKPRSFRTLSQAEEENGQSRIYLGIHWSFDKTGGIAQGRQVANFVYRNLYLRR
jgi:hypothetical protein